MAKRPGGISLMAQGPSFQRAVRLANALRMRDRKKLVDPTDEDIQDMRAKIGDNLSFARLPDANKSDLFCAMLTIRHKLQIYDDLVKSEEEELGPLLSALASLVAAIPNCHGLLTRAVVEMSETCGTTVGEPPPDPRGNGGAPRRDLGDRRGNRAVRRSTGFLPNDRLRPHGQDRSRIRQGTACHRQDAPRRAPSGTINRCVEIWLEKQG
jgi:hypothetical protein